MRFFSALLVATFALCSAAFAQSEAYPNRPVKVIVPLTPGSGADQAGRIVARALSELWKQPVVIENRPGAGGLIGTGAVVQSAPDGYTLLIQSASYAANPAIYKKLPYDPVKGMIDINNIGLTPYVLVTGLPGPYSSLKDLVSGAKTRTGGLPFASAGVGSSTHLAAEFFNQTAGIQMVHVPYKGSPEAIQGTIMGDTSFYMAPESTVLTQIRAGRVKALGVSSRSRSAQLPDVPTIAEQGYPSFEIGLWFGVWAPAGTPDGIVQKIDTDINRVLQLAEVKTQYERLGIAIRPMNQQEFTRFVSDEVVKYTRIAKTAQIEPQ